MNETESFPSNKMEVTNTCPVCAKQRKWDEMTFITTQVHNTHGIQNCVICLCQGCKARSRGKQDSARCPQNGEGVKSGSMNQNPAPQGWQQGAAREIAREFVGVEDNGVVIAIQMVLERHQEGKA